MPRRSPPHSRGTWIRPGRNWATPSAGLEEVPLRRRYICDLDPSVHGTVGRRIPSPICSKPRCASRHAFLPKTIFADSEGLSSGGTATRPSRCWRRQTKSMECCDWPMRPRGPASPTNRASCCRSTMRDSPRILVEVEAFDHSIRTGEPLDMAAMPLPEHRATVAVLAGLIGDDGDGSRATLLVASGRSPGVFSGRFSLSRPQGADLLRGIVEASCAEPGESDGDHRPISAERRVQSPSAQSTTSSGGQPAATRPSLCPALPAARCTLAGCFCSCIAANSGSTTAETGRRALLFPELRAPCGCSHERPANYVLLARLAGPGGTRWRWRTLDQMHHLPRVMCGIAL